MNPDEVFQQGVDAYHAGQHYEAHEFWEEIWQDEPDPDRRRFLQALIQVTSAVHKARHDVAPRGCLRLLRRAEEQLEGLPDRYLGVDLPRLREGMTGLASAVGEALAASGSCRLNADCAPPLLQHHPARWTLSARRSGARSHDDELALFEKGLAEYRQGAFFEAHESWEEIWREMPKGSLRDALQGLIQVAAGMHKAVACDAPRPAARLLRRGLAKLVDAPPLYGLALEPLRDQIESAAVVLARAAQQPDAPPAFDRSLVPELQRPLH